MAAAGEGACCAACFASILTWLSLNREVQDDGRRSSDSGRRDSRRHLMAKADSVEEVALEAVGASATVGSLGAPGFVHSVTSGEGRQAARHANAMMRARSASTGEGGAAGLEAFTQGDEQSTSCGNSSTQDGGSAVAASGSRALVKRMKPRIDEVANTAAAAAAARAGGPRAAGLAALAAAAASGRPPLGRAEAAVPWDRSSGRARTVDVPDVEERGISIFQLHSFATYVQKLCAVGVLRDTARAAAELGAALPGPSGEGTSSSSRGGSASSRLIWESITTGNVCHRVIIPVISHLAKAVIEVHHCSWVELVADGPQVPAYFISHSWGGQILDLFAAIGHLAVVKGLTFSSSVWICSFANNQFRSSLSSTLTNSPFVKAAKRCQEAVLVLDRPFRILDRSWCIFEMAVVVSQGLALTICTGSGLVGSKFVSSSPVVDAVNSLDVAGLGEADNDVDRRRIANYIAFIHGEDAPDAEQEFVRIDRAAGTLSDEPAATEADRKKLGRLASRDKASGTLRDNGELEYCYEHNLTTGLKSVKFEQLTGDLKRMFLESLQLQSAEAIWTRSQCLSVDDPMTKFLAEPGMNPAPLFEYRRRLATMDAGSSKLVTLRQRLSADSVAQDGSPDSQTEDRPDSADVFVVCPLDAFFADVVDALDWHAEARKLPDYWHYWLHAVEAGDGCLVPAEGTVGYRALQACTCIVLVVADCHRVDEDSEVVLDGSGEEQLQTSEPLGLSSAWPSLEALRGFFSAAAMARKATGCDLACRTGVLACLGAFPGSNNPEVGHFCGRAAVRIMEQAPAVAALWERRQRSAASAVGDAEAATGEPIVVETLLKGGLSQSLRHGAFGPAARDAAHMDQLAATGGIGRRSIAAPSAGGLAGPSAASLCSLARLRVILAGGGTLGAFPARIRAGVCPRDGLEATALHVAAAAKGPEAVKAVQLLLEAKIDVDARDIDGNTPLNWAAFAARPDTVKVLLAARADPHSRNRAGRVPLEVAVSGATNFMFPAVPAHRPSIAGSSHASKEGSVKAKLLSALLPVTEEGATAHGELEACNQARHELKLLEGKKAKTHVLITTEEEADAALSSGMVPGETVHSIASMLVAQDQSPGGPGRRPARADIHHHHEGHDGRRPPRPRSGSEQFGRGDEAGNGVSSPPAMLATALQHTENGERAARALGTAQADASNAAPVSFVAALGCQPCSRMPPTLSSSSAAEQLPADEGLEFQITLRKVDGLKVGIRRVRGIVFAEPIEENLFGRWNANNPSKQVAWHDRVVEVNTITSSDQMMSELRESTVLRISFRRAAQHEAPSPPLWTSFGGLASLPEEVFGGLDCQRPRRPPASSVESTTVDSIAANGHVDAHTPTRASSGGLDLSGLWCGVSPARSCEDPVDSHRRTPSGITAYWNEQQRLAEDGGLDCSIAGTSAAADRAMRRLSSLHPGPATTYATSGWETPGDAATAAAVGVPQSP